LPLGEGEKNIIAQLSEKQCFSLFFLEQIYYIFSALLSEFGDQGRFSVPVFFLDLPHGRHEKRRKAHKPVRCLIANLKDIGFFFL